MEARGQRARRVAAFTTLPFQLRGLAPIAQRFDSWLHTSSIDALEAWGPDVVLANDAGSFARLRQYCDRHCAWLIGLRHGVANKYIGPDPEFALADYVCGSEWDVTDFDRHGIRPIRGMLVTGNPWVDDVFGVPPRTADHCRPTILFAPTWNPETSAAGFFDRDLIPAIRAVYPESRIVIKPHPLMLTTEPRLVQDEPRCGTVFQRWVDSYRCAAAADPRVWLADDPAMSVATLYGDADILISDGSSLVFEFALLERPILLYSSAERVSHWSAEWDPHAPGNAMRDVGDQFSTRDEFASALTHAFERHRLVHGARQRAYSSALYGNLRDGGSAERAAEAIRALPLLDVTVVSRKPNERFVADVETTLRNCRVSVDSAGRCAGAASFTLRPSATQRFTDGHSISYASRGTTNESIDRTLEAPMLSFAGDFRPIDPDWIETRGDIRLVFATNTPRPSWQRHLVVSVDIERDGASATANAIVDTSQNPAGIVISTGTSASTRVGRRRFVTSDDLVARVSSSDLEAVHILVEREMREAAPWHAAEGAIAACVSTQRGMPPVLECHAAWLAFDLKARGVRRVVIFGAGSHTALLLPIWRHWSGPDVECILVSDPSKAPAGVLGLPVQAVQDFDVNAVDAVVLSSASHEDAMTAACDRFVPELPVYALWHHSDATGPVTPADRQLYAIRRLVPFAVATLRRGGINRVALTGTDRDRLLTMAVWQAWRGPGIAEGPSALASHTLWCSPGPVPTGDRPVISLWPDPLPSVAPGLLPQHQVAS